MGPIDRQDPAIPFPDVFNTVADGQKEHLQGAILPVEVGGLEKKNVYKYLLCNFFSKSQQLNLDIIFCRPFLSIVVE